MASSGSTNFAVTRDVLAKDSLVDIGAVAQEDSVSGAVMAHAVRLLNMMLKAWQADGMHLWKIRPFTVFLQKGTNSYSLGTTGTHATLSYIDTAMRIAGVTNDTILQIDSTTSMTAGDYILVELDTGYYHATTIASITDSDTLVLTTGITSAAAIDNRIYTYTTKIHRPLAIDNVTVRDSSDIDRPVTIISRQEYYQYTSKLQQGEVVNIYFDPTLTTSTIKVYNTPSAVDKTLECVGYFPLEDMDAANNDFDIPQEWYLAVKANLSVLLGPSYGIRTEQFKMLQMIAVLEKERVMQWDTEKTSVFLSPDRG